MNRFPRSPSTATCELDTEPEIRRVDGGLYARKYLELGIAPRYGAKRLNLGIPVKRFELASIRSVFQVLPEHRLCGIQATVDDGRHQAFVRRRRLLERLVAAFPLHRPAP